MPAYPLEVTDCAVVMAMTLAMLLAGSRPPVHGTTLTDVAQPDDGLAMASAATATVVAALMAMLTVTRPALPTWPEFHKMTTCLLYTSDAADE